VAAAKLVLAALVMTALVAVLGVRVGLVVLAATSGATVGSGVRARLAGNRHAASFAPMGTIARTL